jgi:PAS domain-containing protein
MIGFAGPPGQFRFVSLIDVLRDPREAAALANSYVLVGVTAFGLRQGIVTPVSEREATMSGVEFNANVLDALRSGRLIRPAGPLVQGLMALAFLLVPILVFPRLTPLQALFLMIGLVSATLATSYFMVTGPDVWLATAFPLALLGIGYPVWLVRRLETTSTSLVAEQEHSRAALQSIADAVVTIDPKGFVLQMNAGAERMSGYSSQEAVGLHIWTVFQPVTAPWCWTVWRRVCATERARGRPSTWTSAGGRGGTACGFPSARCWVSTTIRQMRWSSR